MFKYCFGWLLYISIWSKEYIIVWCVVYLKYLSVLLWEMIVLCFVVRIFEVGWMKIRILKIKILLVLKFICYFFLMIKRLVILYSKIVIGFVCCLVSINVWILNGIVIFFCVFCIFECGFIVFLMKLVCVMYYDIIFIFMINWREMIMYYYRLK